jgi:hypothetical protein
MKFKVIKSSFDGISGGEARYTSIDAVLMEIMYFKGWKSKEELHESIRKWANQCRPGDVYCTQVTAIVAISCDRLDRMEDTCRYCQHEGLYYRDIEPTEEGGLSQVVECPNCNKKWNDIFILSGQKDLSK